MKLETNNLSLFGYDLSNGFSWLRLAWRELLWGADSPLLNSMQEPVLLFDAVSQQELGIYCGDQRIVGANGEAKTRAVCLGDDQVLSRRLKLPESLEAELDNVIPLELAANSPFPEDESIMGWQLSGRANGFLEVDLLITHKSDARQAMASIPSVEELWVKVPNGFVVMQGFEEGGRVQRYVSRVKGLVWKALAIVCLLCALPAMVSGFRYLQMEKVQEQFRNAKAGAVPAIEARETLGKANELMARFNTLIGDHPDPIHYLTLLTQETGDDVWLRNFSLKGLRLQVTGYAANATEFIQHLSQLPQFQQVKQRGGIRRDNASGSEVFTLDITLDPEFQWREVAQ